MANWKRLAEDTQRLLVTLASLEEDKPIFAWKPALQRWGNYRVAKENRID